MKKTLILFVAMAIIAFGFTPGAFATGIDESVTSDVEDLSAEKDIISWIGKDVKNMQGEDLGILNGLARDDNGEISLVFVYHDEKTIAVPYSAISFDESEDHAVLDITKDQLASAPEFDIGENLGDRTYAEEVYRHFGERPFWTDEGGAADMNFDEGMETHEYYGTEDLETDGALENIGPDIDIDNFEEGAGIDYGM